MEVIFGPSHDSDAAVPTRLGFSRSEPITHRFIRNLLKTDCNNLATLIAHQHMASRHDRLDASIYP